MLSFLVWMESAILEFKKDDEIEFIKIPTLLIPEKIQSNDEEEEFDPENTIFSPVDSYMSQQKELNCDVLKVLIENFPEVEYEEKIKIFRIVSNSIDLIMREGDPTSIKDMFDVLILESECTEIYEILYDLFEKTSQDGIVRLHYLLNEEE